MVVPICVRYNAVVRPWHLMKRGFHARVLEALLE